MDPMTWVYVIMLVVSLAMSLANRPKNQNAKPPGLTDFDMPTVQEGREVKKIFGRVWVDDPNVLWFGTLRTRPIRASGGK